jgi:endoglucanase
MQSAAEEAGIAYQLQAVGGATPTDARVLQSARGGVATGLISVPLRYMHTLSEVLSLDDVRATIDLLCGYCRRFRSEINFKPW